MFCSEHLHLESGRIFQTLFEIGSKVDDTCKSFHLASGLSRKVLRAEPLKKVYQYCPSSEGLLPAWLESSDHLIRVLRACFKVQEHPLKTSQSRFPVEIFLDEFPEIQDIDNITYYHTFWAMHAQIRAYGLDIKIPWERHAVTLLNQSGAMQMFLPYHKAIASEKYQEDFEWHTGIQNHTYAKDLFELGEAESDDKVVSPALRLKKELDGTASPSYEGVEDLRPKVK